MGNPDHTEVKDNQNNPEFAYSNAHVESAIRNSDWFTAGYIEDIRRTEPYPDRDGLGPFRDSNLGDFFNLEDGLGRGNEIYLGTRIFLAQRMVGEQGHPFNLGDIPFCDDEVLSLPEELKISRNHQFERGMGFEIINGVLSIIAPRQIRQKVVRINQSWGDGFEARRKDVLLWSQLVRKGSLAFLDREKPQI